ncbi:MAG TPA: MMPL family transporter, partial [Candidatus Dormibacteraeota bacterium]|nr:MMPL family transporter [Candidatus Dormibacteraeota bacterium]
MDLARRAVDPYDLLDVTALAQFKAFSTEQAERMFGSDEGGLRLIFIQAPSELTTYRQCDEWVGRVRAVVNQVIATNEEWRGATFRFTGRPAFVAEIGRSMQRDLTASTLGTAAIIALLFWLSHRRWRPMFWLLALLALVLIGTIGIGSLLLGSINVVSLGFAAVLLGLAVDYAVVHYQEALAHPQMAISEVRRAIAPSILWAAITTISAFLVLHLAGLPGLAQLGSLVAIGIALAAVVMVAAFLPPLFPDRCKAATFSARQKWWSFLFAPRAELRVISETTGRTGGQGALSATFVIVACASAILVWRHPHLDGSANALRPQHLEAETALNEMTAALGIPQEPLWSIASGRNEKEVYEKLRETEALLNPACSNGWITGYTLPTELWPRQENQDRNRSTARWLGDQRERLLPAALRAGFQTNALFLTDELLQAWSRFSVTPGVVWPTNRTSEWILKRLVARSTNEVFALGIVYPSTNESARASLAGLSENFETKGIALSGWPLLGTLTLNRVKQRMGLIVGPMAGLVLLSMWLAFRTVGEVLLGVAVLIMSGLCLLAFMGFAGWSWNLLNLMAIPLILGTGVDYSIFIQLGLRRSGGDAGLVRRSIGRALLLCGGTAITGFASLAWSNNQGMASLGKVCATGIAANVLISIFLLPWWWLAMTSAKSPGHVAIAPSGLYRPWLWRIALKLTKATPRPLLRRLACLLAEAYHLLNRRRRKIVIENLLPAVRNDRQAAKRIARRLYQQFALKLVDLWDYENGVMPEAEPVHENVLEKIKETTKSGRGVLIVTPHLGNWEIGGPLFAKAGIPVLAITQAEPGAGFTELRSARRAKWGIETLVIGQDAFAFVEVIRRLQEGAVVALLIDRPVPAASTEVQLFGHPFAASMAPAELARASGCAIFSVAIVRTGNKYAAKLWPEVQYDRRALGTREERRKLTQRLISALEPEIMQNLDQWFHFVPVWPRETAASPSNPQNQALIQPK